MDNKVSIARRIWLDGRLYVANNIVAFIPSHRTRLWFYRKVMKAKIGSGSTIFMRAWMDTPGGLIVGDNSVINQSCRLDSRGGLSIGDNVSISAEVCILTASHDMHASDCRGFSKPVNIGNYVFIGTRALILQGVSIGEGAVVGAGGVVSKDVEPYTIVAGVPARVIGHRPRNLSYTSSYQRLFQ